MGHMIRAITMKTVIVLLLCMCVAGGLALATGQDYYQDQFDSWRLEYGREYGSVGEYQQRLTVFTTNLKYIEQINSRKLSYTLGVNKLADLTFEEFSERYLTAPQDCSATTPSDLRTLPLVAADPPAAIDWREMGAITPVKNQGQCGSCWTFSTTGCLEAHHFLKTKTLVSLSEQQLVDCAGAFNNNGCEGGLPSQAFEYIRYSGGLEAERDYPYLAHNQKCHFNGSLIAATVSNVFNFTQGDEDNMYKAVGTIGPVSIAYDVSGDFRFYKQGVYSSIMCRKDPQHVNHAVLAVGYNTTEKGEPYWIVKNSWGEDFGIKGYFWIVRGKNMCGLADCASYPIV